MKYGYVRVSRDKQNLDLQLDALKKLNCDKIFQEKVSGAAKRLPEQEKLLKLLQPGDTLAVWHIDRLGRTVKALVFLMEDLLKRGIAFISVNQQIDTTTTMGKFIYNVMAATAQMERDTIRERTMAGLTAARSRGRKGGRPKGLSEEAYKTALAAYQLYHRQELSVKDIAGQLKISIPTLYSYVRYIDSQKKEEKSPKANT